ncbi:MAG: phosphonate metabolism transcriptional regulator PhnF [Devosia sp.]|jgi:GntR family phosphonate transport system transcriptional regulator|uniref:phosphonate metabolism transcriptional regulator PhnF n=1 Tax=unclassified Devosia TaxID=196773 RepID=UPI0019EAFA61|nr:MULTISPECIES: phosphonate metabolism transcriptional regulator PhnF [unclassified Devosia]MBF0678681.1 phosphonate metabolism transcriptional regulator PhnF [Devosia sp.]WEJ31748.1 phosphonate metabolism transcriptional regulator PhnF [Devosia sp. SD17-2]
MTGPQKASGGIALWRQIADSIRLDIIGGKLTPGDRLPSEALLAQRFSANRHTVRRALAVLAEEHVVIAEQGRGTFVRDIKRLTYPIGKRTRFRDGLKGQAETLITRLLAQNVEAGTSRVNNALALPTEALCVRMESLSIADGVPVSRSTTWVPEGRFPDFAERADKLQSITKVFESYGVLDYSRAWTRISARQADVSEAQDLHLAPGAVVLVSEAADVDQQGLPLSYALTRFPAERLELVV